MFCLDEPDRHPSFSRCERPDACLRRALQRPPDPVPAARSERVADRRGASDASPPGRAGSSSTRARRGSRRPTSGSARLRARGRAPRADPDPRRSRAAADRCTGSATLVDRYPEATLIIAHAGIADLAELARCMSGRKGVLFDTSTWSPVDLLDFYRRIPPEQVVYASDYPYGQQPSSLLIALKTARFAGLLRRSAARDAHRHGERTRRRPASCPSRRRPVGGGTLAQPLQLARIHQYLSMTTPLLWIAPARHGRHARPGDQRLRRAQRPRRCGRPDPRAARWRRAISGRRCPRSRTTRERRVATRLTFRLIHLADIEAVTTAA